MKNIIKNILFIIVLTVVLLFANKVLQRKDSGIYKWDAVRDLADSEVDMAFFGTSLTAMSIDPYQMEKMSGLATVNLSSAGQSYNVYSVQVAELFKTKKPKIIFIEAYAFSLELTALDNIYYSYSGTSFSLRKLQYMITNRIEDEEKKLELLFPLFMFHYRWENLTKEDFVYDDTKKKDYTHGGYNIVYGIDPQDEAEAIIDNRIELKSVQKKVIDEIMEMAMQKGCKVVFYNPPNPEGNHGLYQIYNSIYDYALEKGAYTLDMNYDEEAMKCIDTKMDFCDYHHTNASGAYKTMSYISDFLKQNGLAADGRSVLTEDYKNYILNYNNELISEDNIIDYLLKLQNCNYIIEYTIGDNYKPTNPVIIKLLEQKRTNQLQGYPIQDRDLEKEYDLKILVRDCYSKELVDAVCYDENTEIVIHY